MTRINCVPVQALSGKHLVAEYRELPRIFRLARDRAAIGKVQPAVNPGYILGPGHMISFTGRLEWLEERFDQLVLEMLRRGYNPRYRELPDWVNYIPEYFWGQWTPTEADQQLCWQRLRQTMPQAYAKVD